MSTSLPNIDPNFDYLGQLVSIAQGLDTTAQAAAQVAFGASAANRSALHFAAATAWRNAAQAWRVACSFYRAALLPQAFQYAANATADETKAAQHQQFACRPPPPPV